MGNQPIDGVINAIRYGQDGNVVSVRIYERRGPTYSDWTIISREELVKRLKKKQLIVAGERKEKLASTFHAGLPIRLVGEPGQEKLVNTQKGVPEKDNLEGVPLF